jgi:RNA-dependent RNA polymerase
VDEQLEGIKMCLRPSMNKFKGNEEDESPIEIVTAFEHPGAPYLNRFVLRSMSLSAN